MHTNSGLHAPRFRVGTSSLRFFDLDDRILWFSTRRVDVVNSNEAALSATGHIKKRCVACDSRRIQVRGWIRHCSCTRWSGLWPRKHLSDHDNECAGKRHCLPLFCSERLERRGQRAVISASQSNIYISEGSQDLRCDLIGTRSSSVQSQVAPGEEKR